MRPMPFELHALQQIQMVDCQTCHVCSQLNNNLSSLFPRLDGNLLLLTEGTKASKTCLMLYPYISEFGLWAILCLRFSLIDICLSFSDQALIKINSLNTCIGKSISFICDNLSPIYRIVWEKQP